MTINFNDILMNVPETDADGVVNSETIFKFSQTNNTVTAEYSGGKIEKGFLIGSLNDDELNFSYCQKQMDGKLDYGESKCEILKDDSGKLILIEYFEWKSRPGIKGKNVFREM